MLRFFSKIRYQLAAENRAAKYLRYAIGEILLVVVGILIALQINNWNEERKQKIKEEYYLERLISDFQANKSEAEREQLLSEFQSENARLLIKSMNGQLDESDSIQWYFALNHLWFLNHTNYIESSWEELKSTGNLELISNKIIVKKISDFYSTLHLTKELEKEWGNFNLEYRKEVNNILETDVRNSFLIHLELTHINGKIKTVPDLTPYLKKLKSINGIQGLIDDIRINREVGESYHQNLGTQIEEIISLLENEIIQSKN